MRRFFPFILILLLVSVQPLLASELSDFTSDGCSLFPDGSIRDPAQWCECCFMHDVAYWRGGPKTDRLQADEAFRSCVLERTGDTVLAKLMYDGVRAGGHPVFPTWYRWGYGWKYGRGYDPLTRKEWLQVAEKMDRYYQEHPEGYCPKLKK